MKDNFGRFETLGPTALGVRLRSALTGLSRVRVDFSIAAVRL
jgi:hypothetical protein